MGEGVVVVGGGFVGLAVAQMVAAQGLDVTVLERDAGEAPAAADRAATDWPRRGVAQFHQAHILMPRGHQVLRRRLPAVADAVERAGGRRFDLLSLMSTTVTDPSPRAGDERFTTVTARRPVLEHALASTAGHLDVRPGVTVERLLTGPELAPGVPHVTGVRTSAGDDVAAALVVDATGRGSRLPDLLADLGTAPIDERREPGGFTYYTRFFAPRPGSPAPAFTPFPHGGLNQYFDSYALIQLPGDAGTWSVTVCVAPHDTALKALRHDGPWTALVAACPAQAPLLDGEPLTGVVATGGTANRWRDLAPDGRPAVTGFTAVGDALCCTDPMRGRGMTLGLLQAEQLADATAAHLDDPLAFARAYAAALRARVRPWFDDTVTAVRVRYALAEAAIAGREPSPQARAGLARERAVQSAVSRDADLFRAYLEVVSVLEPAATVFARPGLAERVAAVAGPDGAPPGPSRTALLERLAA